MRNENSQQRTALVVGIASQVRHADVNFVTSMDMRCHFSTHREPREPPVHYPKFASFARVAVLGA